MSEANQSYLFDLPETKPAIYRPRLHKGELPDPNIVRIEGKISALTKTLRALFPNIGNLGWMDFWLTPSQAGRLCGNLCDDSVIRHMWEGTGFVNTIDVGRTEQPIYRIPLEDCVDFLLDRREGAFE